jgi:hypothetical protein
MDLERDGAGASLRAETGQSLLLVGMTAVVVALGLLIGFAL